MEQPNFNPFSLNDGYKFVEMNEELLKKAISASLAAGNWTSLEELLTDPLFCHEYDEQADTFRFSDHIFSELLALLNRQELLQADESAFALSPFMNNWELLSNHQKEVLLPVLEGAWPRLRDWMARFRISEFMGKYANERALGMLCRLKLSEDAESRNFVPHGLEHIIEDSRDQSLAKRAYGELIDMRNDPSEQVRHEVELSLQRLSSTA